SLNTRQFVRIQPVTYRHRQPNVQPFTRLHHHVVLCSRLSRVHNARGEKVIAEVKHLHTLHHRSDEVQPWIQSARLRSADLANPHATHPAWHHHHASSNQ